MVLHVVLFGALEKALNEYRVHPLGLRMFGAMVWKLLIIEPFSQRKSNTIENWKFYWNFCCVKCKALGESVRFNRVFFTIFRAKVWKILKFLVDFGFDGNSNKLQNKTGFWRKIQFSPSYCRIYKIENLFLVTLDLFIYLVCKFVIQL